MTRGSRPLAPSPLVDRYPIVVGQSLTASYLASVFRLCTTGYRQQFVDLCNELLEQDPHLFSVVSKRILSSSVGRVEIVAADIGQNDPDFDSAQECARMVREQLRRVPGLCRSLTELLWGIYYGLSAAEIFWTRNSGGWNVDHLGFVHSRRLSYPDYQSWSLYIWDQGQVWGWQAPYTSPTNDGMFGLRVADWPGKFIVHQPQLRGDYPTRDGIGRQVAMWAVFKRVGARGAVAYLERFAKSFMDVSWTTQPDGNPREASAEDIAIAESISAAIGPGSGSYAAHPDSVKINPLSFDGGSSSKLTWQQWIEICDAQMSKAALGGTLGTEVGRTGGNRALGEVQERGELTLEQYDATVLGETVKRDLVSWIVRLNRPEWLHLVPEVIVHVDPDPAPMSLVELGLKMTEMGAPVDLDALAEKVGVRLVENETDRPRRSYRSDVLDPSVVDRGLVGGESTPGGADNDADNDDADNASIPQSERPSSYERTAPSKANRKLREVLLMSDRDDRVVATEVFDQLLDDYPRNSLGWVLAARWKGPEPVPLDEIDFSHRDSWRASHEPIEPYIDRISRGRMKPVILVKTPGNPKYVIVDGHHRTLAYERLGRPAVGYVATVHSDYGPWIELHAAQKKGSSKTGPSRASSRLPSRLPSVPRKQARSRKP